MPEALDCYSLLSLFGNAALSLPKGCEPVGIGTAGLDHSQSSAVDSRLSHGKRQQAADSHRPPAPFDPEIGWIAPPVILCCTHALQGI
jgi:hypothetical protein